MSKLNAIDFGSFFSLLLTDHLPVLPVQVPSGQTCQKAVGRGGRRGRGERERQEGGEQQQFEGHGSSVSTLICKYDLRDAVAVCITANESPSGSARQWPSENRKVQKLGRALYRSLAFLSLGIHSEFIWNSFGTHHQPHHLPFFSKIDSDCVTKSC